MTDNLRQNHKKGFTMTELIVVLVITVILAAVLIPSVILYMRRAEFRKNNENAKTVYLTAETMLTYYRSSGQWEDFCEQVEALKMKNESFTTTDAENGRIYAITLERGDYDSTDETNLVNRLLSSLSYDTTTMEDGAISIEIDIETGQVYSAFYATRCEKLDYDDEDSDDDNSLTMYKRTYDERKSRLLGYYSVEDVTNVAKLNPVRLKVTSISLVNSETLYLSWSSTSKNNNLDVSYDITFYKKGDGSTLFSTTFALGAHGDVLNANGATVMVPLTLKEADGSSAGEWYFPVSYKNGTLTLVLDAMMSADVIEEQALYADAYVKNTAMKDAYLEALQTMNTSITRLANEADTVSNAFAEPMDIYATVKANPTYEYNTGDATEYNASVAATSNTANTLYADGAKTESGTTTASLSTMRHLSNIRYCKSDSATFTVTSKSMDWESAGAGLYERNESTARSSGKDSRLAWADSDGKLAFPSIAELNTGYTLTATSGTKIANLVLNADSVADDAKVGTLVSTVNSLITEKAGTTGKSVSADYTEYIGLFCESNGTIEKLTLENPSVTLIATNTKTALSATQALAYTSTSTIIKKTADEKRFAAAADLGHIRGVGVVAGRAQGMLSDISVTTTKADTRIMTVCLEKAESANDKAAAVGGIVGVLARKSDNSEGYEELDSIKNANGSEADADKTIVNLSVSGSIWAYLPEVTSNKNEQTFADNYHYGVGGIIGYGDVGGYQITGCTNAAAVTANYFAGGIAGHLEGNYKPENKEDVITVEDCTNTGLILSNAQYDDEQTTNKKYMQGQFFGGIVGFGENTRVNICTSSAGSAAGYTYEYSNKDNLLVGRYVGGIVGYGYDSQVSACSTKSGGYVLGSDYVGGIVGKMERSETNTNTNIAAGGSTATTNASFVIGNSYVGGIVGENEETIEDCVNNGVAVAYEEFAGGIVGYNATGATIKNCASYLSDYDGNIYTTITTKWHVNGDCVGGIAGYNDGEIVFSKEQSTLVQVKAVSNVIAGNDYVGGVIGFNDANGKLDMDYELIAGSIYAEGDCAGGCIGLNASVYVLISEKEIRVKPQKVQGNNCVGGVIGANVVCLEDNTETSNLVADNALCTITANAFAGGIIGWHRAYTLAEFDLTATVDESGNTTTYPSLYTWLAADGNKTAEAENTAKILPQLTDGLVSKVGHAVNAYTLTITDKNNSKSSLTHATNTIAITAGAYVGGIVGSCDEYSHLTIENCVNAGSLSWNNAASSSVKVTDFLNAEGLETASTELTAAEAEIKDGEIKTQFAGGIIGLNGYNQTISHCGNEGTMSGFTALGGITGVNMGYVIDCTQTANFGNASMDYIGGIVGINVGNEKGGTYTYTTQVEEDITHEDYEEYLEEQFKKYTIDVTVYENVDGTAVKKDKTEKWNYVELCEKIYEAVGKHKYAWKSDKSEYRSDTENAYDWECEELYRFSDKNTWANGTAEYPGGGSVPKYKGNYKNQISYIMMNYYRGKYSPAWGDPLWNKDTDNTRERHEYENVYVCYNWSRVLKISTGENNTMAYCWDYLTTEEQFPNPQKNEGKRTQTVKDVYEPRYTSWDAYYDDAFALWKSAHETDNTYMDEPTWKAWKEANPDTTTITCTVGSGSVINCTTAALHTISGKSVVGGIAGYNLVGGELVDNTCSASVSGTGNDVGGIAGRNAGTIMAAADTSKTTRTIASASGSYIGGLVGYNEKEGTVKTLSNKEEVVAVSAAAQISGSLYVGGLIGGNAGTIQAEAVLPNEKTQSEDFSQTLVSAAVSVRAYSGYAGGALGYTKAEKVNNLGSRCGTVTANNGYAGGVLPEVSAGQTVTDCFAVGTVRSDTNYAGGIAAVNAGTISACTVGDADGTSVYIDSTEACVGAITSVNCAGAKITACTLENKGVSLSCAGTVYGGLAGQNDGTISESKVAVMPAIDSTATGLTVGGAAAINDANAVITSVTISCDFGSFSTYKYFGGVVGENQAGGMVEGCTFDGGKITETSGAGGNCYGGIVGFNAGTVSGCKLDEITMKITGAYTATSSSSAEEKEAQTTSAGGIAGKNDTTGAVSGCSIVNNEDSSLTATNGMLGGVVGFNKGTIENSGDKSTVTAMMAATTPDALCSLEVDGKKLSADEQYVYLSGTENLKNQKYYGTSTKVSANRTNLIVESNGNLGGIAAYNAPTGTLSYCASGDWFLNNQSNAIDAGTGGVIGLNETKSNLSFLLNRAFVGRELSSGNTDRSAGGVIGIQNNTAAEGWTLTNCVNYGTVYCRKTDYAGGIIGQWTGMGGTVEDCRNYGILQTTHSNTNFVGAAGGIVAQLYHAQRDNEYAIISCENYGSIYGPYGNAESCARYSAGILGVIKSYEATNTTDGAWQKGSTPYTVRVLDCVNGPGVKIYSGVIASGIVGFLTCDNPTDDKYKTAKSTANVTLDIERCRNFASVLIGNTGDSSVAGILGDRKTETGSNTEPGCANTYLYDNISVSPSVGWVYYTSYYTEHTDGGERAFISGAYSDGLTNANSLTEVHAARNYFIDEESLNYETLELTTDASGSTDESSFTYNYDNLAAAQKYVDGNRAYIVYNETDSKYILIGVESGQTVTSGSSCIAAATGRIANGTTEVGRVLCDLSTNADTYSTLLTTMRADQRKEENALYVLLYETYRSLEGVEVDKNGDEVINSSGNRQLTKPASVATELDSDSGRMKITITPGKRADEETGDPFAYEVQILSADGTVLQQQKMYASPNGDGTETGSVALSDGVAGELTVKVCALSMYDNVDPSKWADDNTISVTGVLPEPEVRVELVKHKEEKDAYSPATDEQLWQWQFTLTNKDEYKEYEEEGVEITVKFGSVELTLNKDNEYEYTSYLKWSGTRLMMAQATSEDETVADSSWTTASTYLPIATASIGLRYDDSKSRVTAKITGETKDELSVSVTVDASNSGAVDTAPVYEVDLIGTYTDKSGKEHKNTVLATQDLLVAADAKSTVTFEDLPDTVLAATDLKIRVWYASTGLGPAYTWHEVETVEGVEDVENDYSGYVQILNVDTATGETSWSYRYSEVLTQHEATTHENNSMGGTFSFPFTGDFTKKNYYAYTTKEELLTWLDAPEFVYKINTLLDAEYEDNELYYSFYWDANTGGDNSNYNNGENKYTAELYGVASDGSKVLIGTYDSSDIKTGSVKIDGTDTDAYKLHVNADDWSYTSIYLKVSRLGDTTATPATVGQSAETTYDVRKRLDSPAQPSVSIVSNDELDYTVTWSPIADETGCGSYTLWLQAYGTETGELDASTMTALATLTAAEQKDGVYTTTVALDAYAGRQIRLYVVANAVEGSKTYVNSAAGIPYEMTVIKRIGTPTVKFTEEWSYTPTEPFTMTEFSTSGLVVNVLAQDNASIPPGGSTYLLRAYVYNTKSEAETAIVNKAADSSLTGYMTAYEAETDADGNIIAVKPKSMTANSEKDYVHTIAGLSTNYAGKWIVLQTRIASGGGEVSSAWVTSDPVQLPYVQIDAPSVSSELKSVTIKAKFADNPDVENTTEKWTASETSFAWDSVTHADTYALTLQDLKDASGNTGEKRLFRFIECAAEGTDPAYVKVETSDDGGTTWHSLTVELDEDGNEKTDENGTVYVDTKLFDANDITGEDGRTNETTLYSYEVSGSYVTSENATKAYTATFNCTLTVSKNLDDNKVWDGTWHYELILPDAEKVTDTAGTTVTGLAPRLTNTATFAAGLLENLPTQTSAQYVNSEDNTVTVNSEN